LLNKTNNSRIICLIRCLTILRLLDSADIAQHLFIETSGTDVERAPNTTLLNLQGNFPQQNLGLGISLTNDAIGFQRNNTVTLNGAYHFRTNAGILSGGIGVGIINVGFSPNWIPPQTWDDPNLPPAIAGTGFDVNLGLHWHGITKPYYVGISTTHLAQPTLKNINYSVARHYYVLAGYNIKLPYKRASTI
jgi:type IX secretion system PorP/SprF family membrane protein